MSAHYDCPYCGHGRNDIEDIYDENRSYEVECEGCEKVYHVLVTFSASYDTRTDEVEKEHAKLRLEWKRRLKELTL